MQNKILILLMWLLFTGVNVFANDVAIDSDGNVNTGVSNTNGNLEVTGASGEDGIIGSASGTGSSGVYGINTSTNNYGILGYYDYGVYGSGPTWAGFFNGNVRVTGDLTVDGSFTGFSESDPVFSGWDKSTGISITESQITDLNHFGTSDEADPLFGASAASGITSTLISNWNSAYSWGNHAAYDSTNDSWTGTGNIYTTTGSVGIGTTSPAYNLDVHPASGTSWVRAKSDTSYAGFIIDRAYTTNNAYVMYRTGGLNDWFTGMIGNSDFAISTSSTSPDGKFIIQKSTGYVGIGTSVPDGTLTVESTAGTSVRIKGGITNWPYLGLYDLETGGGQWTIGNGKLGDSVLSFSNGVMDRMVIDSDGNIGIGTTSPAANLHVLSSTAIGSVMVAPNSGGSGGDSELLLAEDTDGTYGMNITYDGGTNQMYISGKSSTTIYGPHVSINRNNGYVGMGTTSPSSQLTVRGNITIENSAGTIIAEFGEGLDYAEGFDVSDASKINSGTVLVIDPENPGKLTVSSKAYDTKVAGIVAGANGLGSGVRLGADKFDSDVALAGRVYCNVDATDAGVQPGDLLTTASLAGHAMKASDYDRARGAILGKAMESLDKGKKGQILVLVTLQ